MPSTKPGGRGGAIVEQGDAVVQSERGGLAPLHKKEGPDILLLQGFFPRQRSGVPRAVGHGIWVRQPFAWRA
jgi:hypothetical protein